MAEQTTLESLLEMGFGKNSAEKAVANTGNQGIERAMDWLQDHQNDPDIDEPYVPPAGNVLGADVVDSQAGTAAQPTAAGAANDDADLMEKVRKIEEEKSEKVKRLEQLMREKQAERIERERVEEVEREKQRRRQGQELTHVRQKMQDEERMKLVELQQREKMEDKIAKQRVKEKIARDREERMRKCGGGSSGAAESSPPVDTSSPPTSEGPPPPSAKKEYDESRIQVRLLDGSAITAVFKAQESLAAVRVYVQTKTGPGGPDFNLLSPYPRHVYTEMDMEKPLKELGLVPSAVLIVTKKPVVWPENRTFNL